MANKRPDITHLMRDGRAIDAAVVRAVRNAVRASKPKRRASKPAKPGKSSTRRKPAA